MFASCSRAGASDWFAACARGDAEFVREHARAMAGAHDRGRRAPHRRYFFGITYALAAGCDAVYTLLLQRERGLKLRGDIDGPVKLSRGATLYHQLLALAPPDFAVQKIADGDDEGMHQKDGAGGIALQALFARAAEFGPERILKIFRTVYGIRAMIDPDTRALLRPSIQKCIGARLDEWFGAAAQGKLKNTDLAGQFDIYGGQGRHAGFCAVHYAIYNADYEAFLFIAEKELTAIVPYNLEIKGRIVPGGGNFLHLVYQISRDVDFIRLIVENSASAQYRQVDAKKRPPIYYLYAYILEFENGIDLVSTPKMIEQLDLYLSGKINLIADLISDGRFSELMHILKEVDKRC